MKIFRQWPLYFVGRILPAALAFGAIGLYTRLVDPASFGTYALLLSTALLFGTIGFSWLRVATLRLMATVAAEDAADFSVTIAVSFVGVAVVIGAALFVAIRLWNPALPLAFAALTAAVAIASNWFELNVALAQARIALAHYGSLQAARAIGTIVATLLLIRAGFKAEALLGGFALGNCVAFAMLGTWLRPSGRFRSAIFARMFRFGWPSSAGAFTNIVATAQRYLLGAFGGAAAVGLFAVSNDFAAQTVGLLIGTVTLAGQPLAFRARDLGAERALYDQLRNNARLLFAVGFAATAGLVALAGPISHAFFGPAFRSGAEPILILAAFTALVAGLRASYFEQAFEIALETRPIAVLTVIRIALILIPSWPLIVRYGAIGAACAVLAGETTSLLITAVWARRLLRMPVPLRSFAWVVAASLAMVLAIVCVPNRGSLPGLVAAIGAGLLTYALACALIYSRQIVAYARLMRSTTVTGSRA